MDERFFGCEKHVVVKINLECRCLPYQTEGREGVKVGVQFDRNTMTIGEYLVG